MSIEELGKESTFNEAALKMQRLHTSQMRINDMRTNLLLYYPEINKYGYEIVVTELLSLMSEARGKLSYKRKQECVLWRNLIINALHLFAPYENKNFNSLKGVNQTKKFNKKNWEKLMNMIFNMEDFVKEIIEETGYSSPSVSEEEGYD